MLMSLFRRISQHSKYTEQGSECPGRDNFKAELK